MVNPINHPFINLLERATFQVSEIQAVVLDDRRLGVYTKHRETPFEFTLPDAKAATLTYETLSAYLCKRVP